MSPLLSCIARALSAPWASCWPLWALLSVNLCCDQVFDIWLPLPFVEVFFLSHTCSVNTLHASPCSYFLTQTPPCWLYTYLLRWSLPYLLDLSPALLSRGSVICSAPSTQYPPQSLTQQVLHPCSSNEVEHRGCFDVGRDGKQGGRFWKGLPKATWRVRSRARSVIIRTKMNVSRISTWDFCEWVQSGLRQLECGGQLRSLIH